jgi:hypothetical protein
VTPVSRISDVGGEERAGMAVLATRMFAAAYLVVGFDVELDLFPRQGADSADR